MAPAAFADRRGGPTVYEGTGYQTGVAVLEALHALSRVTYSPTTLVHLRCEPRELVGSGQLGYDFGIEDEEGRRDVEAKAAPMRAEVVELLARLRHHVDSQPLVQLELAHGKDTRWTAALAALLANAAEATSEEELQRLVAASGDRDRALLLQKVGDEPRQHLARMRRPALRPPRTLEESIGLVAVQLAGPAAARALVEAVTARLEEAFRSRESLLVPALRQELHQRGLLLPAPAVPPAGDQDLLPGSRSLLASTPTCLAPVPDPAAYPRQWPGPEPRRARLLLLAQHPHPP